MTTKEWAKIVDEKGNPLEVWGSSVSKPVLHCKCGSKMEFDSSVLWTTVCAGNLMINPKSVQEVR